MANSSFKETLNLYVYNVHCKHIIFGASADNSYASFLGSFHDIDIANRIRLLEGPPFAAEFKTILPRFKQLKFPEVFRSTKIDITQKQFSPFKKPTVDTPKRRTESYSDPMRELIGGSYDAEKRTSHKLPSSFVDRVINQSLPDRTITSPSKPSFGASARPVSPTKNLQDTSTGGVSLNPRQRITDETALLRGLFGKTTAAPTAERIEKALIRATLETLEENPRSCDFANVKRRAETKLGVDASIWGRSEEDLWFNKSKTIIKWTVEHWLAWTNKPLPGNATWLFKYFPSGMQTKRVLVAPSAKEWRTQGEPEWENIFDNAVRKMDIKCGSDPAPEFGMLMKNARYARPDF